MKTFLFHCLLLRLTIAQVNDLSLDRVQTALVAESPLLALRSLCSRIERASPLQGFATFVTVQTNHWG